MLSNIFERVKKVSLWSFRLKQQENKEVEVTVMQGYIFREFQDVT